MINSGTIGSVLTAVTPSDTLAQSYTALYIGTTGNVSIQAQNGGNIVTFMNVPVGFFPVACQKVMNTLTTASNIIGIS